MDIASNEYQLEHQKGVKYMCPARQLHHDQLPQEQHQTNSEHALIVVAIAVIVGFGMFSGSSNSAGSAIEWAASTLPHLKPKHLNQLALRTDGRSAKNIKWITVNGLPTGESNV